jgi:hypothetical protein
MSRLRLSGFGAPIPIPDDIPEASSDSIEHIPRVNYILPHGTIFRAAEYMALHYTHYEVVVIGAVGGRSGRIRGVTSTGRRIEWEVWGGAGGGGGLHIVKGRLLDLPAEVPVVIGQPGSEGIDVDAGDGEASQFGEIAMASGGKGGKAGPPFQNLRYRTQVGQIRTEHPTGGGSGGDGGKGGQIVAGGGGRGARFIQPIPPADIVNGVGTGYHSFESEDGKWDGDIGEGGGGGMGGVWLTDDSYYAMLNNRAAYAVHPSSTGARGSFSRSDTSRFMDGQRAYNASAGGFVIPGHGGGATINRRTLGSNYGGYETRSLEDSHLEGVVFIRLRRKL